MTKLFTYIVKIDSGLAPNPFWDYCTLAVCTPNHQGSRAQPGDWIAGFLSKANGYKFLYAMEVSERIYMADYYSDPRFKYKRPLVNGRPIEQCGDNFYSLDRDGTWIQHPNPYHQGMLELDTRKPWVFVARRFWYLGNEANLLPDKYKPMVGGRVVRCNHPEQLKAEFMNWVINSFPEGRSALPRDLAKIGCKPTSPSNATCVTSPHKSVP